MVRTNWARRAFAAAAVAAAAIAAPSDRAAAQTNSWAYAPTDNGALTRICSTDDSGVCVILFCAVTDRIRFGFDGFREGGRITEAPGAILVDGRGEDVTFNLRGDGGDRARLWVADVGDTDDLLDALSRGDQLTVRFGFRDFEFDFSLRGSSRAIRQLFATCSAQGGGGGSGGGGGGGGSADGPTDGRWRFSTVGEGARSRGCVRVDGRVVCAALYCRADGAIAFGVEGHDFDGRRPASGRIRVSRINFDTRWVRAQGPEGRVREAEVLNIDVLMDLLSGGSEVELSFDGRAEPFSVALRGSRAAIRSLRSACEDLAGDDDLADDDLADDGDDGQDDAIGGQQQRWQYLETNLGGAAFSCTIAPNGRERCAVLACDGQGLLRFGLDGAAEGGRRDTRSGAIEIDGEPLAIDWRLTDVADDDRIWLADLGPRATRRLSRSLAQGSELVLGFGDRRFAFTLAGSGRAVRAVRASCDALLVSEQEEEDDGAIEAACALHSQPGLRGDVLFMGAGERLERLGEFDGRVRSASVADGCAIRIYSGSGFRGFVVESARDLELIPFLLANTVSSAQCRCR